MPVFRSQQEIDEYVRFCISKGKTDAYADEKKGRKRTKRGGSAAPTRGRKDGKKASSLMMNHGNMNRSNTTDDDPTSSSFTASDLEVYQRQNLGSISRLSRLRTDVANGMMAAHEQVRQDIATIVKGDNYGNRIGLSPSESRQRTSQEIRQRRNLRLKQVRQQEALYAKLQLEKRRLKAMLSAKKIVQNELKPAFEESKQKEIQKAQLAYQKHLAQIGQAHKNAKSEMQVAYRNAKSSSDAWTTSRVVHDQLNALAQKEQMLQNYAAIQPNSTGAYLRSQQHSKTRADVAIVEKEMSRRKAQENASLIQKQEAERKKLRDSIVQAMRQKTEPVQRDTHKLVSTGIMGAAGFTSTRFHASVTASANQPPHHRAKSIAHALNSEKDQRERNKREAHQKNRVRALHRGRVASEKVTIEKEFHALENELEKISLHDRLRKGKLASMVKGVVRDNTTTATNTLTAAAVGGPNERKNNDRSTTTGLTNVAGMLIPNKPFQGLDVRYPVDGKHSKTNNNLVGEISSEDVIKHSIEQSKLRDWIYRDVSRPGRARDSEKRRRQAMEHDFERMFLHNNKRTIEDGHTEQADSTEEGDEEEESQEENETQEEDDDDEDDNDQGNESHDSSHGGNNDQGDDNIGEQEGGNSGGKNNSKDQDNERKDSPGNDSSRTDGPSSGPSTGPSSGPSSSDNPNLNMLLRSGKEEEQQSHLLNSSVSQQNTTNQGHILTSSSHVVNDDLSNSIDTTMFSSPHNPIIRGERNINVVNVNASDNNNVIVEGSHNLIRNDEHPASPSLRAALEALYSARASLREEEEQEEQGQDEFAKRREEDNHNDDQLNNEKKTRIKKRTFTTSSEQKSFTGFNNPVEAEAKHELSRILNESQESVSILFSKLGISPPVTGDVSIVTNNTMTSNLDDENGFVESGNNNSIVLPNDENIVPPHHILYGNKKQQQHVVVSPGGRQPLASELKKLQSNLNLLATASGKKKKTNPKMNNNVNTAVGGIVSSPLNSFYTRVLPPTHELMHAHESSSSIQKQQPPASSSSPTTMLLEDSDISMSKASSLEQFVLLSSTDESHSQRLLNDNNNTSSFEKTNTSSLTQHALLDNTTGTVTSSFSLRSNVSFPKSPERSRPPRRKGGKKGLVVEAGGRAKGDIIGRKKKHVKKMKTRTTTNDNNKTNPLTVSSTENAKKPSSKKKSKAKHNHQEMTTANVMFTTSTTKSSTNVSTTKAFVERKRLQKIDQTNQENNYLWYEVGSQKDGEKETTHTGGGLTDDAHHCDGKAVHDDRSDVNQNALMMENALVDFSARHHTDDELNEVSMKVNSGDMKVNSGDMKANSTDIKANSTDIKANAADIKVNAADSKVSSEELALTADIKVSSEELALNGKVKTDTKEETAPTSLEDQSSEHADPSSMVATVSIEDVSIADSVSALPNLSMLENHSQSAMDLFGPLPDSNKSVTTQTLSSLPSQDKDVDEESQSNQTDNDIINESESTLKDMSTITVSEGLQKESTYKKKQEARKKEKVRKLKKQEEEEVKETEDSDDEKRKGFAWFEDIGKGDNDNEANEEGSPSSRIE
eukprot:g979.t1